jgi:glycosidase
MLMLARDLIALRRQTPELQTGRYVTVTAPEGAWAWRRGERVLVVLNMSDDESTLTGTTGHIHIATDRERDGESFDGALTLRAWEAAIAEIR